jgi:hypothetical protein
MTHTAALNAMHGIRINNPFLIKYGGFGYCAYASELLRQDLVSKGIRCKVMIGTYFRDTKEATIAKSELIKTILSIAGSESNESFRDIKASYLKRKDLPVRTGHAVVLVDNVVYDCTSGQFKLPETYSFNFFSKVWETIHDGVITLGDINDDFGVSKVTQKRMDNDGPAYSNW